MRAWIPARDRRALRRRAPPPPPPPRPAPPPPPRAGAGCSSSGRCGRRRRCIGRDVGRDDRSIARKSHAAVVLAIGVDPVRRALIHGRAIHLSDGQRDAGVALWIRRRSEDAHAAVAGHDVVTGHAWRRVPPDVMTVAAPAAATAPDLSAVARSPQRAVRDQHVVGIVRRHADADVVARASDQPPIPAHVRPRLAGVVGSPQRALRF